MRAARRWMAALLTAPLGVLIYVAVDHAGAFQPYYPAGNYDCH